MRTYLSFGGGVNSVAMYLLLMDEGMVPGDPVNGFEALYVDHGCDWPETREYVAKFAERFPLTVLTPCVEGFSNLYDYYLHKAKLPSIMKRDCTDKFKIRTQRKYVTKPCFFFIGFDAGESHRATISTSKGIEQRYPLIEREINRKGCIEIIKQSMEPVPPKSGCFLCMYQAAPEWRKLRRAHPEYFCKVTTLEKKVIEDRISRGKKPLTLCTNGLTVREMIQENQRFLFKAAEYPPCQCGL